tara:strand:+ start:403 stop:666 length:264 start_codon:yes stop_codon:yes gene_type:complete
VATQVQSKVKTRNENESGVLCKRGDFTIFPQLCDSAEHRILRSQQKIALMHRIAAFRRGAKVGSGPFASTSTSFVNAQDQLLIKIVF